MIRKFKIPNYKLLFALLFIIYYLLFARSVTAAPRYPLREIGNCRDAKECSLYCQIPKNYPSCWSFGKYILNGNVLGETTVSDEAIAKEKNVKFPIADLGNCKSVVGCRQFCAVEANRAACKEFALKKKLLKAKVKTIGQDLLNTARKELGCVSSAACFEFCLDQVNRVACQAFGEKYSLVKKAAVAAQAILPEVLQKSRLELGCSNEASCKNLCDHPDNQKKCAAFAKKYTLRQKQPASTASALKGCQTEEECRQECRLNPDKCPGFPIERIPSFENLSTSSKEAELTEADEEPEPTEKTELETETGSAISPTASETPDQ